MTNLTPGPWTVFVRWITTDPADPERLATGFATPRDALAWFEGAFHPGALWNVLAIELRPATEDDKGQT